MKYSVPGMYHVESSLFFIATSKKLSKFCQVFLRRIKSPVLPQLRITTLVVLSTLLSFIICLMKCTSLKQGISAGHVTAFSFVLKLVVTSKDMGNAIFRIDGSVLK